MARGIGMSGRRRTQLLDQAIGMLSTAGYEAAAQKLSDFRDAEWDLGEEQAVMNAVSVGHFATFVRARSLSGRMPLAVRENGDIGLDVRDGDRCLSLTFQEDGLIAFEATGPVVQPAATGKTTPDGLDSHLEALGGWNWARSLAAS